MFFLQAWLLSQHLYWSSLSNPLAKGFGNLLLLEFPEKAKSDLGGLPDSSLREQFIRWRITIFQNMQQYPKPILLLTHIFTTRCSSLQTKTLNDQQGEQDWERTDEKASCAYSQQISQKKKNNPLIDAKARGERYKEKDGRWQLLISNCMLFDKLVFPLGFTRSPLQYTSLLSHFLPSPIKPWQQRTSVLLQCNLAMLFRCMCARWTWFAHLFLSPLISYFLNTCMKVT